MEQLSCGACGAPLSPTDTVCARCGTGVAPLVPAPIDTAKTPAAVPAKPPRSGLFLVISLLSVAVLFVLIWFALSRFPFGTETGSSVDEVSEPKPVSRSSGSTDTGVIEELEPPPALPGALPDTSLQQPPLSAPVLTPPNIGTAPLPPLETSPPPVVTPAPANPPAQVPAPSTPDPAQDAPAEISGGAATDRLWRYITNANYYNRASDCYSLRQLGYRNVGYGFEVWSRPCDDDDGSPELLGRWRVDAKTGEVFVQRNGRYLRP